MSEVQQLSGGSVVPPSGKGSAKSQLQKSGALKQGKKTAVLLQDTDIAAAKAVRKSGSFKNASTATQNRKECIDPIAWNRSEVSNVSEAGMMRPKARGERKSQGKVTSMRSSLFKKMAAEQGPNYARDEEEEGKDSDEEDIAAKAHFENSIAKRMRDLDSVLGVQA